MQEEQFARFSPSELIKLAFFCALLEQTPHTLLASRRFKLVKSFVEEITRVTPIESLHSALANPENDDFAAALCEGLVAALADAKIPPSLSLWRNSLLYAIRQDAYGCTHVHHEYFLGVLDLVELISVSLVQFGNVLNVKTAESLFKMLLISAFQFSDGEDDTVSEILRDPSKNLAVTFSNEYSYGMRNLCDISATGFPSAAISSVNLYYLFTKCSEFAPLTILELGIWELTQGQTHALSSLQDIKVRLSTVTSIICAFMHEHVRVPLVDNVASFWKLTKLYVRLLPPFIKFCVFCKNLDDSKGSEDDQLPESDDAQVYKAMKPMAKLVQQKLYENSTLAVDSYVTRLQLLVKGTGSASCLSEQCKEYFLEAQLMRICQQLTITAATPTEEIVSKWDELFKRTALFSIAKSFRPLVARWIRWSLMIHNLRHEMARHTAVGVVGLVNSGKSQLVNKLFQIKVFT